MSQPGRWPCALSEPDVKDQQARQRQADCQMNPARPRTQVFIPGVVKSVSCDRQNTERTKKQGAIPAIPTDAPREAHVTRQKHSNKHQNCHRGSSVDFHRPRFCAHLKIAGRRSQIIPERPCRSGDKKQREHGVEKPSLETLQSNRVRSAISHDKLNFEDGRASRSNINASARY